MLMYNVNLSPDRITDTIFGDYKKAKYWHTKMNNGKVGLEKIRANFMAKSLVNKNEMYSGATEYTTVNGDKWYVLNVGKWIDGGCAFGTIAFSYYETASSCGVFDIVETANWEGVPYDCVCLHFTDHFFLRYMDRTEYKGKKMNLVFEVIKQISSSGVYAEKADNGDWRCDIHISGGIGRGYISKKCPFIEIRTFLTDKSLNNKQKGARKKLLKNVAIIQQRNKQLLLPVRTGEAIRDFYVRHMQKVQLIVNSMNLDDNAAGDMYLTIKMATFIAGAMMTMQWDSPSNNIYWDKVYDKCVPVIIKYIKEGNLEMNLLNKVKMYKECFDIVNRENIYPWNKKTLLPFVQYCTKDNDCAEKWIDNNWVKLN